MGHSEPLVASAHPPAATVAGPAAAPSPDRRRPNRRWYRLVSPVVVVGLWQAASSTGILPASKLVSPASIAHTAYTLVVTNSPTYGTLQESLLVSFERWAAVDPIVQALRSIPLLGLIPLFIVWFGIGERPKVLFVLLSALFPMYLNTFAGIRVDTYLTWGEPPEQVAGKLDWMRGLASAQDRELRFSSW